MIVRVIDEERLCVLLSQQELEHLSLTAEALGEEGEQSKRALLRILSAARRETGFTPTSQRLTVEVFPWRGGCALCFSPQCEEPAEGPVGSRLLFVFPQLEDLLEGALGLFQRYCHRVYKSSLYQLEGQWWLLLTVFDLEEEGIPAFLSEYGTPVERLGGDVFVEEHGRPIILENAIDRLAYYLAPPQYWGEPNQDGDT